MSSYIGELLDDFASRIRSMRDDDEDNAAMECVNPEETLELRSELQEIIRQLGIVEAERDNAELRVERAWKTGEMCLKSMQEDARRVLLAMKDQHDDLAAMVRKLTDERDHARRLVCRLTKKTYLTLRETAELRRWDCFKENKR